MIPGFRRHLLTLSFALCMAIFGLMGGMMSDSTAEAMADPNGGIGNATSTPWRYLALGDSYTIGESVREEERFPAQLTRQLRADGMNVADAGIIARTGWTTDELDNAINANTPQGTFDLVTLLIGVNNQYRHRSAESYRPEFVHLLQRAIAFAGNRPERVVVVSIPDWGVTPFGRSRDNITAEINTYNFVNREETARLGAHYVDITPISREAQHDADMTARDGLHPSGKMYARWVELILPVARKILHSRD